MYLGWGEWKNIQEFGGEPLGKLPLGG